MPQDPHRPRVLIADDDPRIRVAVSQLLSGACEIVGHVSDTAALLETTRQLRPDVVLLDFTLRGSITSLEACRQVVKATPEVKVVFFTAGDDEEFRAAALEAGASAFVWKMQAADLLLRTIHDVVD